MPDYQKDSHCSYCGTAFPTNAPWPHRCIHCRYTTYRNPLPVSVVLLPMGDGLLLVRRIKEPAAGRWGLPGGFIEVGESWQEAGAREVFEETGFTVDPAGITLFDTRSAPDGTLLVFGLAASLPPETLTTFRASAETSEAALMRGPTELAFSTHTETAARYWAETNGKETKL